MDTINTEVGMLASKIEKVEKEVAEVKEKVAKVESALRGGEPYLGISDRQHLLERLGALEKEKEQLREKELRLLPASSPPAASGISAQGMQRLEEMFQALCSKQEETKTRLVSNAGPEMWEELRVVKSLSVQPAPINFAEGPLSAEIENLLLAV